MYINKVILNNIQSIGHLEINFSESPYGWHVLIGDNGSGKSSILRAISAALIGPNQIHAVNLVWDTWVKKGRKQGKILLEIQADWEYDKRKGGPEPKGNIIRNEFTLEKKRNDKLDISSNINKKPLAPSNYNWGNHDGWFSVAYGPFRRFWGGDEKSNRVFFSSPKAGAHLSIFGEEVSLIESLEWLRELDNKRLRIRKKCLEDGPYKKDLESMLSDMIEGISKNQSLSNTFKSISTLDFSDDILGILAEQLRERAGEIILSEKNFDLTFEEGRILHYLKHFLNKTKLLPNNAKFNGFDLDGNLEFIDGNENKVKVKEMSDGYRTMLSLTFELIRQLISTYGDEIVFKDIKEGSMQINLPGVVIIDEIDAHLHPTWQTRIGAWFTQVFPKIQFIVTTHSPLICRASENGTIWKLNNSNEEKECEEIVGSEKERLIFGNILDAYGTTLFGKSPVRSHKSNKKLKRLGELNMYYALEELTKEEEIERQNLLQIFTTDDPTGFEKSSNKD